MYWSSSRRAFKFYQSEISSDDCVTRFMIASNTRTVKKNLVLRFDLIGIEIVSIKSLTIRIIYWTPLKIYDLRFCDLCLIQDINAE